MNRITEVLAEEPRIRDDEHTRLDLPPIRGEVTFEDVDFAYGDRPVLHGVSFTIPAGGTVATVSQNERALFVGTGGEAWAHMGIETIALS